jgi:5-methyltetrahydropteroyltriglutamate--homocysteine methyltransferase
MERHTLFSDRPLADFVDWVDLVVGALNDALNGLDPAMVRLHVCWGNYEGPHTHDVALEDILPSLYRAEVGALVVSMANPRHAHAGRTKWPLCAGRTVVRQGSPRVLSVETVAPATVSTDKTRKAGHPSRFRPP